jgi:hypothetical protein
MGYWTAGLLVIGATLAAGLASIAIGRAIAVPVRKSRHETGIAVFQQVGVMFAVLLAFVFNEVWSEYTTAAEAINGECGALHGASILADALPAHAGRPVNQALLRYGRTVVDAEWPMMAGRRGSAEASEDFRLALDNAARLQVTATADLAVRAQIVELLARAHAFRETRLFQMDQGMPIAMWAVLLCLALSLQLLVLFAGVDLRTHVVFASAFAGCTAFVLVLVRMLDYPFEGALALSNADFQRLLGELSALLAGH